MSFAFLSWLSDLLSFSSQKERDEKLMNVTIEQSIIYDFHMRL